VRHPDGGEPAGGPAPIVILMAAKPPEDLLCVTFGFHESPDE